MIGKEIRLNRLIRNNKSLFLAMDQGIEHGPNDFNDKTINPGMILGIAEKGRYNGIILHKGIVLNYFERYAGKIPLILKLNGKTNIPHIDVGISEQLTSVKDAVRLGADAIGYTIYTGTIGENLMLKQFGKVEEEARDYGMPIILWMYPRGRDRFNAEKVAYAARIGMELGADMVKVYYTGSMQTFKRVVLAAQKTRVLCAGGEKKTEKEFLKMVRNVMNAGAAGLAVGRNVWQHNEPLKITKKIKHIVFKK